MRMLITSREWGIKVIIHFVIHKLFEPVFQVRFQDLKEACFHVNLVLKRVFD